MLLMLLLLCLLMLLLMLLQTFFNLFQFANSAFDDADAFSSLFLTVLMFFGEVDVAVDVAVAF